MGSNDMFDGFNKSFTRFFWLMFLVVICHCVAGLGILYAIIYSSLKLTGNL